MTEWNRNEIIIALETGTVEEKSDLLEEILGSRDISLLSHLVDLLEREKSRVVKERILMVLGRLIPLAQLRDEDVNRDIDRMLRSSDAFIRNGIVDIIKHAEIPISHFLQRLAQDKDKHVRKFVIDALSQENSEKAIEIIRSGLQDPEINIVYTAIEYLGNLKDNTSVDQIETLLISSDNLMVICSSFEALAKIGQSPQKDKILEKFMKRDTNPVIIFALLKYLGTFGNSDALSFLDYVVSTNAATFTKEIIDTLEGIVNSNHLTTLPLTLRKKLEVLQQKTPNQLNKYALTKLLIKTAEGNSVSTGDQLGQIREMLLEKNEIMQLCAIEILAEIGDASDIERMKNIAQHMESDELLEAIGDAVVKIDQRLNEPAGY